MTDAAFTPQGGLPKGWGRAYTAPNITVYYNRERCIHYAACVRGLPQVFDTQKKPWVQPENACAEQVAEVVRHCPTGALHYVLRKGPAEQPEPTTVDMRQGGPYFLRGNLTIETPAGEIKDTRAALCRCGQSGNKPFCDATHREVRFEAAGGAKKINGW